MNRPEETHNAFHLLEMLENQEEEVYLEAGEPEHAQDRYDEAEICIFTLAATEKLDGSNYNSLLPIAKAREKELAIGELKQMILDE